MRKTKKILALALAAAMTCSLAACGGGSGSDSDSSSNPSSDSASGSASESAGGDNSSTSTEPKHLNFSCYNYSNSMDPTTNVDSSWVGTRFGVTECLFRFDENIEVQNNLCDDYKTDDYKTWELHIRDGVKFTNGNPLTASAVAASLQRAYDKEADKSGASTPSQYVTFESITADDETGTVTLVCTAETFNLPGILSYPFYAIVDTSVVDTDGVIGTGPYKVTKIQENTTIDFAKNEDYWGGEVPYDSYTAFLTEDSTTKAMALQSGDVDLVENITTPSDLETLKGDSKYYVSTTAGVRLGSSYLNFKGQLGNDALRQAIQLAVDDETMCNVTVAGMYTPGASIIPTSLDYGQSELNDPYTFDKDKAIAVLDEAGIVDSDGDGVREIDGQNIALDYIAFTSRNLDQFAEAVSIALNDIGIGCKVTVLDYDTALAKLNEGDFDMMTVNSTVIPTGDPTGFMGNFYSGNSDAFGFYSNEEYDKLYEQLLTERDEAEKKEITKQMQQILIDDAATLVHGYYNSTMASNASVVSGGDIMPMDYYWITTDIKPAQ